MSTTIVARAVIGCEVTGKIHESIDAPGCAHSALQTEGKCCIECGKPRRIATTRPCSFYDEGKEMIAGRLPVAHTGGWSPDRARWFAGFVVEARGWDSYDQHARRADAFDLSTAKETVRIILEPLGLWDETSFGLWSVLYYS